MKLKQVAAENTTKNRTPAADNVSSGNNSTFEMHKSKDPIVPLEKDIEALGGGNELQPSSSHKTSYLETFMHLYKSNVGSGIFALGDAFKNAGLLLAVPLSIALGVMCIHTQYILLNCGEEVMRRLGKTETSPDYATTVELCFQTGPVGLRKYAVFMRKLVNLFLGISQIGICCVYLVFVSTNLQQVLGVWDIPIGIHAMTALLLVPVMLSTWIRNLKYLVPLSTFANVLITYGYVATVYVVSQDLPAVSARPYVAGWRTLPLYFGTAIYSFEGIALVLPLKNEMRRPRNFDRPLGVLNVGMCIIGAMLISLGFLSYLKYGEDIKGSVTLNLEPQSDPLPLSIRLAISLSIMLSYALQLYVPVSFTWPTLEQRYGPFRWPVVAETSFRTVFCLFTFVLAEAIPKLDLFISLIGAISSTTLALVFPLIIDVVIRWQNGTLGVFTMMKNAVILLIGIVGCASGTYESISQIVNYFRSPT